jgi:hypothetical protein
VEVIVVSIQPLTSKAAFVSFADTENQMIFQAQNYKPSLELKSTPSLIALDRKKPSDLGASVVGGLDEKGRLPKDKAQQIEIANKSVQNSINKLIGFDAGRDQKGQRDDKFYSYDEMPEGLLDRGISGYGGINIGGYVFTFVDKKAIKNDARYFGVDPSNFYDAVVAQEALHSIHASHPKFKGKINLGEQELMGEAVSFTQSGRNYIASHLTMTNDSDTIAKNSKESGYGIFSKITHPVVGRVARMNGIGNGALTDAQNGRIFVKQLNDFCQAREKAFPNRQHKEALAEFARQKLKLANPDAFVGEMTTAVMKAYVDKTQEITKRAMSQKNITN